MERYAIAFSGYKLGQDVATIVNLEAGLPERVDHALRSFQLRSVGEALRLLRGLVVQEVVDDTLAF